jgi:hypothetical protein
MRLVVSKAAEDLIAERGGRVYVWTKKGHCCGAGVTLETATEPPAHRQFASVERTGRIELFLPSALSPLPEELHLDAHRFPRRVEAYWNGCAWVA